MTEQEKLAALKADLQMLTNTRDDYLTFLLSTAEARMTRMGIEADASADYDAAQIQLAAYLFRKRAASTNGGGGYAPDGGESAMPRFLRLSLNELLLSQKARSV